MKPNRFVQPAHGQPNATWQDLKQYAWGVASVLPFIAAAAYGARVLVGNQVAFWLGIGIFAFVVAAYGLVVVACVAATFAVDVVRHLRAQSGQRVRMLVV